MEAITYSVEGRDKGWSGQGFQWGETFINTQQDIMGNTGHPHRGADKWEGWEGVFWSERLMCDSVLSFLF